MSPGAEEKPGEPTGWVAVAVIENLSPEQQADARRQIRARGLEAIADVLRRERPGHVIAVVDRPQDDAVSDGEPGPSAASGLDDHPADHRP